MELFEPRFFPVSLRESIVYGSEQTVYDYFGDDTDEIQFSLTPSITNVSNTEPGNDYVPMHFLTL